MPTVEQLREILEGDELVQRLAEAEHKRWSHWQQYLHDKCERRDDGSLIIPADLVERWSMQIDTAYADLSDEEKKSDQEQVRQYLPIIVEAVTT